MASDWRRDTMPKIARLVVKGEKIVYHVMSRTALAGYVLEDVEKDFLLRHIRWLSKDYFTKVLGFCMMGNHILVRMEPGQDLSVEEIRRRFGGLLRERWKAGTHRGAYPGIEGKMGESSRVCEGNQAGVFTLLQQTPRSKRLLLFGTNQERDCG